jgi:hypothetical protein
MRPHHTPEQLRLDEDSKREKNWKRWGPYLSERQWGTVREDYSANGDAWNYFPHDHARSRAYRWGEDGLLGFSDRECRMCFALSLWNGRDPFLKERLYGLTNPQGNHGEDVKEWYWYLDSTPTHSYAKALYKYPQAEYPYARLIEENSKRSKMEREYELEDTGAFDENRYFDVFVEYAKAAPDDLLIRITIANRGPELASIHVLPTLWFRNVWTWGAHSIPKPHMDRVNDTTITAMHATLGRMHFEIAEPAPLLFTENNTNCAKLFGSKNETSYVKDAFHEFVVNGRADAVNPANCGTKAAAHYVLDIAAGEQRVLKLRLRHEDSIAHGAWVDFDKVFTQRLAEADAFYESRLPANLTEDQAGVVRQAYAGLLWSKQYYEYVIKQWIEGDPATMKPPAIRAKSRNSDWPHLFNSDIISMPDKWEYPWYAAWDLAFHTIPLALVDAEFAKEQLVLLTREWYMHPNGQMPAYEWAFGDVNPPVHAWATWRVFQIDRKQRGDDGDLAFLERVFHKLMLNFTWWVNRKDAEGRNVFQGGFLGLDNIGVFDRSAQLPTGGHIDQADGTSWMAMYALNLMRMALELAQYNPVYEDVATKFFEHFLHIAEAMSNLGEEGIGLWDDQDKFFYDVLHTPDGRMTPLKVRSMVGLIPLFAVETLEPELLEKVPNFTQRMEWFLNYRPDLARLVSHWDHPGRGKRRLLSLLRGHRMKKLLARACDENEFLSPFGIRAISKAHEHDPYVFRVDGMDLHVRYTPAESDSGLFGGNSNWRGPIWFPVNYLIIESLQKFHHYYGNDFKVECPVGSGRYATIGEVAQEISTRLTRIFLKDENGARPVFAHHPGLQGDPHFRDHVLFYEYFHGDVGRGVGASHQTGWTGLIAKLLQPRAVDERRQRDRE